MSARHSRRQVLLAMGGAATLPLVAGTSPAIAQELCEEEAIQAEAIAEIRSELSTARAEQERLPDLIAERQRQILRAHAAQSEPQFPSDIKSQAMEIALDARESVVVLDVEHRHGQGTGTAWFATEHHLLTNAHNIDNNPRNLYGVTIHGETFEADVVGRVKSQSPDVALLRTDHTGTPLSTGNSHSLARDDPVVQVGHPGAEAFGFWAITLGGFQSRESQNELIASVPGLTGSSGSPILDLDGVVVAMTYGGGGVESPDLTPTDDEVRVGLLAAEPSTSAVPIETAMDYLEGWT